MELTIGLVIAAVFLVPALVRPTLGRLVLSLMFVGGSLVNLLYTFPNAPDSLIKLVATAPIPPYREVIALAVAWTLTPALTLLVVVFELTAGLLILGRGPLVRIGLLGAAAWGLGMLPVIPPEGLPIGIALTGAPGLAGLLLLRRAYPERVLDIVSRTLPVGGPRARTV